MAGLELEPRVFAFYPPYYALQSVVAAVFNCQMQLLLLSSFLIDLFVISIDKLL